MERTKGRPHYGTDEKKWVGVPNQDLRGMLSPDGFIKIDRRMITVLGLVPSVLLSTYIDKYTFLHKKKLTHNNWFFCTHKQIMEELGLTITTLRRCKNYLIDNDILKIKSKGIPAKEWFYIDFLRLNSLLVTGIYIPGGTKIQETTSLINKTKYYNNNSDESSLKPNSDFPIVPNLFETFWKLYPKHPDKGKALTAWNKICKKPPKDRPTWKELRRALKLQKESERWQDPKFIPHPTTWLNNARWLDDPDEMKSFNRKIDNKDKMIIRFGRPWTLRDNGFYYNKDGERLIE